MSNDAIQVEALLFALGRPLSRQEVMQQTGLGAEGLDAAVKELQARGGGTSVVDDGRELELRVAPAASELIDRVRKEEYARDIGKAGLEALAAIVYRGPLSRAEIDFIRGVNSSQTLRTLSMRGLVRRVSSKDQPAGAANRRASVLYEPTTELLAELGASSVANLPEYDAVRQKLAALEEAYRAASDAKPAEETQ